MNNTQSAQYTVAQIRAMAPQFREMIHAIGVKLLSFKENPDSVKEDMFWDVDGNKFRIHLSSNALNAVFPKSDLPFTNEAVVSACLIIGGGPYVLHLDRADFDKPLEEVLSDKLLDELTESLVTQILYTMAQRWMASNNIVNRMKSMVKDKDFAAIESFTGLDLLVNHNEQEYQVAMWSDNVPVFSKAEFNPMKGKESNYYLIACTKALLEAIAMAMVEDHGFKQDWTHAIVTGN